MLSDPETTRINIWLEHMVYNTAGIDRVDKHILELVRVHFCVLKLHFCVLKLRLANQSYQNRDKTNRKIL